MKAKTQIRIGLWGAILVMVIPIYGLINNRTSSNLTEILLLIVNVIYISSIIRKDLKTSVIAYYLWLIPAFFLLSVNGTFFILCTLTGFVIEDFVILLRFLFIFCLNTSILWMGTKGLKRIIEAESVLKEENSSQIEKK